MRSETGTRRRLTVVMAVAMALVLLVAGVASAETFKVKAKKRDKWGPVHTYIGEGDRVVWVNPTKKKHDVTAIGDWSYSKVLRPGERAAKRFRDTGTFRYRCARHSAMVNGRCRGMCGIVHVFSG